MDKLSELTLLSEGEISDIIEFTCNKLKEKMMPSYSLDVREKMKQFKSFINIDGRLYMYGIIDDDDEMTIKNLQMVYDDVDELNTELGTTFHNWEDVENMADILLHSREARHSLQKRCHDIIPTGSEACQLAWLKSVFLTLNELNLELGLAEYTFTQWRRVPLLAIFEIYKSDLLEKKWIDVHILKKASVATDHDNDEKYNSTYVLRLIDDLYLKNSIADKKEEFVFSILASVSRLPVSQWYIWMLIFLRHKQSEFNNCGTERIATWVIGYYGGTHTQSLTGVYDLVSQDWGVNVLNYQDLCHNHVPDVCTFSEFFKIASSVHSKNPFDIWGSSLHTFSLFKTQMNGNCFFESLATALNNGETVDGLRRRLADILPRLSPDKHEPGWAVYRRNMRKSIPDGIPVPDLTTVESLQEYVKTARHWATDTDIKIFAYMYDLHFILINHEGGFNCLGYTTTAADRYIILFYEEGLHYDLVIKNNCGIFARSELPPRFFDSWLATCGALDMFSEIHPL